MTEPDAELLAWAPKPPEQAAIPVAMSLPGYSDFVLVAEGGEGTVYRARQDGLGRYVAIKVINMADQGRLARFRRELEITVRLGRQHPHIVTVIDTGTTPAGLPCIVMEYYDLGSLHDRLRQHGPLPVSEVVAAGVAVADALAFAHSQGFLHRDVKPQNILVLPTSYVLADFGIARMADAGNTTSLQMVSYRHAAPQMIEGQTPAAADDLWSLGSTLFTLLDGAPPFASQNPDEDTILSYLDRVRSGAPRAIRRADIPPELTAVIAKCLSRRREDRPPDAAALRSALAAIEVGTFGWTPSVPVADFGPQPVAPPAAPAPEPKPRPERNADLTVAGPGSDLAGLTVRLPDEPTSAPDFGPRQQTGSYLFGPSAYAPAWTPEPAGAPAPLAEPTGPVAAPRRRRGRRVAVFAFVAVLIGGTFGVGVTILKGQSSPEAAPPQQTTSPAPTATTEPGQSATTTIPAGGDPAITPTLNRLDDNGASITLTWTDPTAGKAQFVIVDVTGDRPRPLVTVTAGATTHTVDGLDAAAGQYCFQVIAIGLADPNTQRAASARVCAVRQG